MTKSALLKKGTKPFIDKKNNILHYKPQKIRDSYGYQYLIKGTPTPIEGTMHRESYLENNPFGRYGGDTTKISTPIQLSLGDLIEYNGVLYAVEIQLSYNDPMKLKHFVLKSLYDYYKEFIIDTADQANRILGVNSMRYLLAFAPKSGIAIIPARFDQTSPKQIRAEIVSTQTISTPFRNKDNLIQQNKKDNITLWGSGLDTNDLQEFLFDFFNNAKDLGFSNFPFWKAEERYNKEFDLRANIHSCNFDVYYSITNTNPLDAEELIKGLAINLNGSDLTLIKVKP